MDKKPKRMVPEVRFKGFTDDWEQRKLGEVLTEFQYGLNTPAISFNGIDKYIRITDIDENTHRFNVDNITSPKETNDDYLLTEGDILFARTGASVGKTYIYNSNDGKIYYAGFLIKGHIRKNYDSRFVFETTLLSRYTNFVKITSIRSGQPGINANEYKKYTFYTPTLNEQRLLSTLMQKLEKLLSLQQRKLEQLKQLKKAMLQKISNHKLMVDDKEYENMKVKVADIYTVTRGNVLAKGKISPQKSNKYLYPVYSSQTKNDGLMGYYEKYLFENAITWTTDGANAGTVKYREGKFYSTNVNGVLLSNKGYANKLAASLLNQVAFKYVSHVGNPKLMNNVMKEITFQIPKNVKVQIKLSKYLALLEKSIDNQLVIENEYKKLRKFLLQKLFI